MTGSGSDGTRLIIVRHATPHEDHPSEPGDPPLTTDGAEQAKRLADRLAIEGIDRIVSSPQQRARETARPLSERLALPVEILDGLAEVDFGTDRYRSPETIKRESPERWQDFLSSPITYFGLKEEDFRATVLRAFEGLFAPDVRAVAVFSHGTPIKIIVQHALKLKSRAKISIGHCSVTRISGPSLERLIVECVGEEPMWSSVLR